MVLHQTKIVRKEEKKWVDDMTCLYSWMWFCYTFDNSFFHEWNLMNHDTIFFFKKIKYTSWLEPRFVVQSYWMETSIFLFRYLDAQLLSEEFFWPHMFTWPNIQGTCSTEIHVFNLIIGFMQIQKGHSPMDDDAEIPTNFMWFFNNLAINEHSFSNDSVLTWGKKYLIYEMITI